MSRSYVHKKALKIGDHIIEPGERVRFSMGPASLYDFTDISIPIEVIRGAESGPTLFITAVVHGDEINGFEIIRKLLRRKELKDIKGTLMAIPIVNVFGFNRNSRYLPDRRDLNRAFPGSKHGSLAARIAHTLMSEVVKKCTHGIDLHTGALHRANLPQIRAYIDDPETLELAKAFSAPLVIHSSLRDGSLRAAASQRKLPTLLFEGGEALRFDERTIKVGVQGCLNVMAKIGMIHRDHGIQKKNCYIAQSSHWIRASHGGCIRVKKKLGQAVREGDVLGVISDPFDRERFEIYSKTNGVVIGISRLPLVNKGDAVIHIATSEKFDGELDLLDE